MISTWVTFDSDLLDQMSLIISGLLNTLQLAFIISITGFLLGIFVFYLTLSKNSLVRSITNGYISFFIGTPLIVLLFLMYYGIPQWGVRLNPLFVSVIGFTFNVGAYNAAYLKTSFNALDPIQIEAANAQGFRQLQIFQFITLPQVLRTSVPALTNQVISNLKDTSITFLIQYTEFFARMQELASTNFQFFKAYILTALVYLILVSLIVLVARIVERKIPTPIV